MHASEHLPLHPRISGRFVEIQYNAYISTFGIPNSDFKLYKQVIICWELIAEEVNKQASRVETKVFTKEYVIRSRTPAASSIWGSSIGRAWINLIPPVSTSAVEFVLREALIVVCQRLLATGPSLVLLREPSRLLIKLDQEPLP